MTNWLVTLGVAALALYSFFFFPGHTYLTQDTQIYLPILENLWDSTALTNDILVGRSHVAFTFYDEYAIAARWLTHSSFAWVLQTTQVICRAMGIWGVYLIALSILKRRITALAAAAVCSLGAEVWGPAVLVVEFEPSPRAFAIPLVFLALGLIAQDRVRWAAIVGTVALLLHPTSAAPFWLVLAVLRQWRVAALSLVTGLTILAVSASFEPGMQENRILFARVPPTLEAIQRTRAAYNWVGMWFSSEWLKYLGCLAAGTLAYLRLKPDIPSVLRPILIGLPFAGVISLPLSFLLLDRLKWAMIPQVQPARLLLFTVAIPILLAATAAFRAKRAWESPVWLTLALIPAVAAPRPRIVPTPALASLSRWAAVSTPKNSVFLFPQAGKSLEPGLFRSSALRAVYVDWKGGGQANFLPDLGLEWWRRYQDVMMHTHTLNYYRSLGIDYLVYPNKQVVDLRHVGKTSPQ